MNRRRKLKPKPPSVIMVPDTTNGTLIVSMITIITITVLFIFAISVSEIMDYYRMSELPLIGNGLLPEKLK